MRGDRAGYGQQVSAVITLALPDPGQSRFLATA
jgi:hypothetical protein